MPEPIAMRVPVTPEVVQAIEEAGAGACVTHPRARSRLGRVALGRLLTEAGVPHRQVMTLEWRTSGGRPVVSEPDPPKARPKKVRKKKQREAEASAAAEMLADQAANADKE